MPLKSENSIDEIPLPPRPMSHNASSRKSFVKIKPSISGANLNKTTSGPRSKWAKVSNWVKEGILEKQN